jgi:hypothetical protein
MFLSVQMTLETHKDVWEPLQAFADAEGEFDETIASIQTLVQTQLNKKGGVADKAQALNGVADAGFEVAAAVRAFATASGDSKLATTMSYSRSEIVRGRDSQMLARCQSIHDAAAAAGTSLTDYGITPAKLTAFQNKIDAFASAKAKPRQDTTTSSAATKSLRELFAQADTLLNDRLDGLAFQFKDSQPSFYNEYTSARIIVDRPGGHGSKAAPSVVPAQATLPKAA